MSRVLKKRRQFLIMSAASSTAILAGAVSQTALAKELDATETMRGGANNYRPGAPVVDRIGGGGFWMTGSVRRAGS